MPESGAEQAYGTSISRFQPQSSGQGNWGLVDATQELLDTMRLSNPNLKVIKQGGVKLEGRVALSTLLETDSPLQGQRERDLLVTTRQGDSLFSIIFIAPESSLEACVARVAAPGPAALKKQEDRAQLKVGATLKMGHLSSEPGVSRDASC